MIAWFKKKLLIFCQTVQYPSTWCFTIQIKSSVRTKEGQKEEKGNTSIHQMSARSGLLRLYTSFPGCIWSLDPSCYCHRPAHLRLLALWRMGHHCDSHLSDRCLPPKQWIIGVLHLSGGTHLAWSAAFLPLFHVIAWHLQSAYPAPFFQYDTPMLCLCLAVSLFLSFFSSPFFPFTSLFAHLLTKLPKSNRQADYVREGKNKRKIIYPTRGIWREVIYLPLFLELTYCLHSSWCATFLFSLFSILLFFFSSDPQLQ